MTRPAVVLVCAWLLLAGLLAGLGARPAQADVSQTSIMQDDQNLIFANSNRVIATLAQMQQLGVETVRVNVEWNAIAPDPLSRTAPSGFEPGNPAAVSPASYPAGNWTPYDRLVELAPLYGITVQLNLTGPGPLWAMAANSPTARASTHWKPNAADFEDFVAAVAQRYDGSEGFPRVSDWSIWNEPNQPGWLAPQWQTVRGRSVPQSPRLYRSLVDAAWKGLTLTGHTPRHDTILIGETAPEGNDHGGFYTAMTPLPFLRDLYCVSARDRPLRGRAATALGCPTRGRSAGFVTAHPALFQATGYAHHPYDFYVAPNVSQSDATMAPLSDIGRLTRLLDRTLRGYGVHRRLPLYFTEYGYETRPPDPHKKITLTEQAAFLNESDYMSWRLGRVRAVAQFLLYDSAPDARYRPGQYDYWDTFQTGLLFLEGRAKPSLAAYRMPIWLPITHVSRPGTRVLVWGQVRPADRGGAQTVRVQFRARGLGAGWRTLARLRTRAGTGYFSTHVRLPASGTIRTRWSGSIGTAGVRDLRHGTFTSRSVPVRVAR